MAIKVTISHEERVKLWVQVYATVAAGCAAAENCTSQQTAVNYGRYAADAVLGKVEIVAPPEPRESDESDTSRCIWNHTERPGENLPCLLEKNHEGPHQFGGSESAPR